MNTELLTAWEQAKSKSDFVSRLPLSQAVELLNQINAAYGPVVSRKGRGNLSGPRTPIYGKDRKR